METPFLGPAYVARSSNLADNRLINLFAEIVEGANGKAIGGFYMTPGLDYLATCGLGPVRQVMPLNGIMYVVSGSNVYSVNTAFVVTLIGTVANPTAGISWANNEYQLIFTDTTNLYLLPPGFPLTGGTVSAPGTGYIVGDVITLVGTGGSTVGTAQVTVASLSGSGVATFTIAASGSFPTKPTTFAQSSTTGSGSGFVISSPTWGSSGIYEVPLPFANPVMVAYQDDFGLLTQEASEILWQSIAGDLSIWPPLNFASADAQAGYIYAIGSLNDQVWVVKQFHTEIWVNASLNGFAFQRLAGSLIEHGIAAPYSLTTVGDSWGCISQDENGLGVVVLSNGYVWVRISTSAIEAAMAKYSTILDAIGFSYQREGHLFYVLTFPTGNATWVYDVTASADSKVPMWHQEAAFLNGAFNRHWANCYVQFGLGNATAVVGDYRNGNLYALNLDTQLDNWTPRKWLRSWRALPKPSQKPIRFPPLVIDMETGIGVPSAPSWLLNSSGGQSFTGGATYADGDTITLVGNDGVTVAPAILVVSGVSGGVVGAWHVASPGNFTTQPTGFTQASTSGSGTGFTLTITNAGLAYTGLNSPNPQVMLRWTDDGGHNYSNQYLESVGRIGKTGHRVKFTRIGSTKRGHGLDRVFELSSSDQFTVTLIGAVLGDE